MQTFPSATGATPPRAAPHGERHPAALPTLFFTDALAVREKGTE
jgi:hypothetical protein